MEPPTFQPALSPPDAAPADPSAPASQASNEGVTDEDIEIILSRGKDLTSARTQLADKDKKGLLDFSSSDFAYQNFEGQDYSKQVRVCCALLPAAQPCALATCGDCLRERVGTCFVVGLPSCALACLALAVDTAARAPHIAASRRVSGSAPRSPRTFSPRRTSRAPPTRPLFRAQSVAAMQDREFMSTMNDLVGKRERPTAVYSEREPRGFSAQQAAALMPKLPKMRRMPEMRDFQL